MTPPPGARAALLGAALLVQAAPSRADAATPLTETQIIRHIAAAQRSVAIYTPWLRNERIERALASAAVNNGVQIFVVTPRGHNLEPADRINNLILAGYNTISPQQSLTRLYTPTLKAIPSTAFMVIDGRRAIIGNRIGLTDFDGAYPTQLTTDLTRVGGLNEWLIRITTTVPAQLGSDVYVALAERTFPDKLSPQAQVQAMRRMITTNATMPKLMTLERYLQLTKPKR